MQKIVFSSNELPAQLGNRARSSLWRDLYAANFGRVDLIYADDRPFSARFEFSHFGIVGLGQFAGTISRLVRTSRQIAADANHDVCLVLNRGRSRMSYLHRGRESDVAPGAATIFSDCDVADMWGGAENAVLFLQVPRARLLDFVADTENLAGAPLDRSRPAVRYLQRYLDLLLKFDGIGDDPELRAHIGTTLLDLVVLALGAERDGAELARMRGLRLARLQHLLVEIKAGFAESGFTVLALASKLGLSPRYVQDLLYEAGSSFTERVLELRLQKARTMLSDRRYDSLKVIEIALACGFDSISYFNRRFRARFGASPTELRSTEPSERRANRESD